MRTRPPVRPGAALGILCASLAACEAEPGAPPAPVALELAWAGCRVAHDDGRCELDAGGELTIWGRASAAGDIAAITVEGADVRAHSPVDGGQRLRLRPRAPVVQVCAGHGQTARCETLAIVPVAQPAIIGEARQLLPGRAAARVRAALPMASTGEAPRLWSALARLELARGDTRAARSALRTAARQARDAGLVSIAVRDELVAALLAIEPERRFDVARRRLARITDEMLAVYPEARAHLAYHRAVLAVHTRDHRSALRALDEAETWSARLDLTDNLAAIVELRAQLFLALGRGGDALALLEERARTLPADASACARAQLDTNLGWTRLMMRAHAPGSAASPRPAFERALAAYSEACASPGDIANSRINLALAALQDDEPGAARAHLAALDALGAADSVWLMLWRVELDGRLALAEGAPDEARKHYRRLAELAADAGDPDAAWRAAHGRAVALQAAGAAPAAVQAAHRDAEAVLDGELASIPVDVARAPLVATRARHTAAYLEALVAAGAHDEAVAVARRSRRRAIAHLERGLRVAALDHAARARWERLLGRVHSLRARIDEALVREWQLPADRLAAARDRRAGLEDDLATTLDRAFAVLEGGAPPAAAPLRDRAPGELLLVVHPGSRGWLLLAAGDTGASVVEMGEPGAASATAALTQLAPLVERAERITVLPYGPWWQIDLHALPWADGSLADHAPVRYALDLPPTGGHTADGPDAARAVVIADPTGDLPGARRDGARVVRALATRDLAPALLRGELATATAVREAMTGAALVHYAGHGRFAGPGGWDSRLPLAAGTALSIADILSMSAAPARVVLAGCDTARLAAADGAVGIGLAQAFLLAGSEQVVAAFRPVDDGDTEALTAALYEAPITDLAAALARAQAAVGATASDRDTAAFRVLVR